MVGAGRCAVVADEGNGRQVVKLFYVMEHVFDEDQHPALGESDRSIRLPADSALPDNAIIDVVQISRPSKKRTLGEFHAMPQPLVTERVIEILKQFDLPNVQFLKTRVSLGERTIEDRILIHVYNVLDLIDRTASVYKTLSTGAMLGIKSLRLSAAAVGRYDVKRLQLFRLKNCGYAYLVNQHLYNALQGADIKELRLIPINEWHGRMNLTPRRLKKLGLD